MFGADRYELFAPLYDLLSGEWPIYRSGRVHGIKDLHLQPGMTVLDLGCGTGLNFELLEAAIGSAGRIIGIDNSPAMLARARARAARNRWFNVTLIQADATLLGSGTLDRVSASQRTTGVDTAIVTVDAIIATYALSVISDWQSAWAGATRFAAPGARACIVDMKRPTGIARPLSPLARLACRLGGANIDAHPWTALEQASTGLKGTALRGGHIQVRTGNLPTPRQTTRP